MAPIMDCKRQAINPTVSAQFPVLETSQGSLCESAAIARYIASLGHNNLYPQSVTPTSKGHLPTVLQSSQWCHACHAIFGMRPTPTGRARST